MPDTNHFTGLPVPLDGEASNGPLGFDAFRAALAGHTVLFAESSSQRDALYADAPVGSLCSSTTASTVWLKTAMPNVWAEVFSDTGWISLSAAAWGTDYEDNGSFYRRTNGSVSLILNTVYVGSDISTGSTGNVPDETMVVLPSEARFQDKLKRVLGVCSISGITGTFRMAPGGAVAIMTATPNSTISNGAVLQGNVDYSL